MASQEIKEYQYNKLLDNKHHMLVARAQYVVKLHELFCNDEIEFEFFKKELDKYLDK